MSCWSLESISWSEAHCPMTSLTRFLAGVIGLVAGLMAVLLWPSGAGCPPPVLNLVSMEAAGIFDDSGAEMWLGTLSISHSPHLPARPIYVKDSNKPFEAKVPNRWIRVDGA